MVITLSIILLTVLMVIFLLKNILCNIDKDNPKVHNVIIPIGEHKEDIEFILRNAINKIQWENKNHEIICLDKGMDKETQKICEIMSKDYSFVHLKKTTHSD